jgi:hypothetical protein
MGLLTGRADRVGHNERHRLVRHFAEKTHMNRIFLCNKLNDGILNLKKTQLGKIDQR